MHSDWSAALLQQQPGRVTEGRKPADGAREEAQAGVAAGWVKAACSGPGREVAGADVLMPPKPTQARLSVSSRRLLCPAAAQVPPGTAWTPMGCSLKRR